MDLGLAPVDVDPTPMTVDGTRALVEKFWVLKNNPPPTLNDYDKGSCQGAEDKKTSRARARTSLWPVK